MRTQSEEHGLYMVRRILGGVELAVALLTLFDDRCLESRPIQGTGLTIAQSFKMVFQGKINTSDAIPAVDAMLRPINRGATRPENASGGKGGFMSCRYRWAL